MADKDHTCTDKCENCTCDDKGTLKKKDIEYTEEGKATLKIID